MDKRFLMAMGVYAALALVAWLVLEDELLWVTWFALAVYAFKSWLVVLRRRLDS